MTWRKIEMLEIREVVYQWQKGKRNRAISYSLGVSRNTIRDLLRKAQLLGLKEESGSIITPRLIFLLKHA